MSEGARRWEDAEHEGMLDLEEVACKRAGGKIIVTSSESIGVNTSNHISQGRIWGKVGVRSSADERDERRGAHT